MKAAIYVLLGVLLLVLTFADREGGAGVTAWVGIILLTVALVGINVSAASRTRPVINSLNGSVALTSVDHARVSAIVPGFPSAGRSTGWMEVRIAGQPAFMRRVADIRDGDVVTAAGLAGSGGLEILALYNPRTALLESLPDPGFRFGEFAFHVALGAVVLLPVVIGIFTLTRTTRGYNWTNAMRAALEDSRQLARITPRGPGGPAASPSSLDGVLVR